MCSRPVPSTFAVSSTHGWCCKVRTRRQGDTAARLSYPHDVSIVRLLLAQRHLAVLICAAALLLKLLVPTGYMIAGDHGRLTITICPGDGTRTMATDMPGMHGDMPDHGTAKDHGKAEMPCPFTGLSAASIAAVSPILLAGLIAAVMSLALAGSALPPRSRHAYFRPPLRGPPASL